MKKSISSLFGLSFLQAAGAFVVVWLWAELATHGETWFGKTPNFMQMLAVPLIFMIIATLSAGAVLGYPLYLAFHKKDWPLAIRLLGYTLVWLAVIATILIFTLAK